MAIRELKTDQFPSLLKEISDPPKKLFLKGALPDTDMYLLAVVGSRKLTHYGKEVCEKIIMDLSGMPIVIVSGLAIGIDGCAHRAALKAGLQTIAVPGSGLENSVLYPRSHVGLAEEIVEKGGALLSEFDPHFRATQYSFPQRNRIMAGMSHGVLIIEAARKSGTLITARLATEYNRDVFTVPGSIFSRTSYGPHDLIKDGACPVTSGEDILNYWNLEKEQINESTLLDRTEDEKTLLKLLEEPLPKEVLLEKSKLPIEKINILLSSLELDGLIEESAGEIRRVF